MDNQALKKLVGQGLSAMKAGSKVAADATAEIRNDARHPDLKHRPSSERSRHWRRAAQSDP